MRYEESFKQYCMNLVVKEGRRTKASVLKEFNLSQVIIKKWIDSYEEKRSDHQVDLEQRQRELKKRIPFLKKRPPSLLRTKTCKIFVYSPSS